MTQSVRIGRPTVAEELASFSAGLDPAAIPAEVKDDARWRLMDTLGVAIAGRRMDSAASVLAVANSLGGEPQATAIGSGRKLPAPMAGWVNGALAHMPDFDDTHSLAMVHISCTSVPAALAMGERVDASGAEMLTALVAGGEIGLRIGAAVPHRFHAHLFHATPTCGTFVAAAAGSKLLGNDVARTANSLGIAASQSAGLLQGMQDGSWIKRLHPGSAVQSGLLAALLAEQGFTGPREIIEGVSGLYRTLLGGEEFDAQAVCAGLGETWLYPDTVYKPYPNGAWNHSSTDGVIAIMREHGLAHTDVERIDCSIPVEGMHAVCDPRENRLRPQTPYHMKFSLYYSVAILAVLGHEDLDDYTEAVRIDPRIAEFAARIYTHGDESLKPESFPARVTLSTKDGRSFETHVRAQRGGPGNRMAADDHRRKFTSNVIAGFGSEGTEQLRAAIEGIWEARDLKALTSRLAAATP